MVKKINRLLQYEEYFERFAFFITNFTAGTAAFVIAVSSVIVWVIVGSILGFTELWQFIVYTGPSVITFLMVFIIQRTHDKDSLAIQLKLNELIAAVKGASNRLIDVETLSEADLELLKNKYTKLAKTYEKDVDHHKSLSIEEAEKIHNRKLPAK